MTDEKDRDIALARQILELKNQVAELRISVSTLKVFVLFQIMPDQLQDGLRVLRELEAEALKSDPALPSRKRVADVIDALEKLKKRGASLPDS